MILRTEKKLSAINISSDDVVTIKFNNVIVSDSVSEDDDEAKQDHTYTIKSKMKPHKDLYDCLKKLRKFALEICEIDVDSKGLTQWSVCGIKITGDVEFKTSRVVITLIHDIKKFEEEIKFNTPQVIMYPEEKMPWDAEKMAAIIEDIIEECWSYLNGKCEESNQIPLFPHEPKINTHFTS